MICNTTHNTLSLYFIVYKSSAKLFLFEQYFSNIYIFCGKRDPSKYIFYDKKKNTLGFYWGQTKMFNNLE